MNQKTTSEWVAAELKRMRESFIQRGLPEHMWSGVRLYMLDGIPPGHFLTHALEDSLSGAYSYADEHNKHAMREWVMFFYNDLPSGSWGSKKKVSAWIERGGLNGIDSENRK